MQGITWQQFSDAFGSSGEQKVALANRRPCLECLDLLVWCHRNLGQIGRLTKFVVDAETQMQTQLVEGQLLPRSIVRCDVANYSAGGETFCLRPRQLFGA